MSLGFQQPVHHLCHRPYCIQPGHLYSGTPQQNALDRYVRLKGKLHPDWPLVSRKPTDEFVEEVQATVQQEGGPLLNYVGQMNWLSMQASRNAWSNNAEFQLPLPSPEGFTPGECPGHSFRIPVSGDFICSICGVFQSDT